MCKVLGVSRSGYYKWLQEKPSKRAVENQEITTKIRSIHEKSDRTYGSPRITAELRSRGVAVSRVRVARLMRQAGIHSEVRKKYVATTNSKHDHPVAENLLDRNFQPEQSGQAWVSDITYIRTGQGWLYLTIIMELRTRKIIGWALSQSLHASHTSMAAWKMAALHQPPKHGLFFHSDRGVQYACADFIALLKQHPGVVQSMSRRANCWDNAVAESFFKTLKVELIYRNRFDTRKQAEIAVFEYIETWYNTRRRHSAIGYMAPADYEQLLLNNKMVA